MGALVGKELTEAGPGELVVKPRGVPHAFWNAGAQEARALELVSPGGFERYFAELAPVLAAGAPPDLGAIAQIQARYGLEMDFESIGPLSERFGLAPPG
jgi:hypothetical protein